ncbi:MAG: ATP-grasp domain-containing protein [Myxococcales bacterium]|jgi:biotin carboxylase
MVDRERQKNVFVLGADPRHLTDVRHIPDADRFAIHGLLRADELIYLDQYPIDELLDRARAVLDGFEGPVDAIIGHWDFPVSVMVPILCAERGLPAPSLESVLKCEHKYWSRVEQRKVVPEHTPEFCAVDPFAEQPFEQVTLDFPFWVKPVKAYGSALGFRINERADFDRAIEAARRGLRRFGDPFNRILSRVELPEDLGGVDGNHLLAEQLIGGREIAPEGYVQHGVFHAHGMIDMVRAANHKSFLRYEYPSSAPRALQQRAIEAARKTLAQVGFDDGCFNMEFFWNDKQDRLWIIEVNSRISQSHSYLFRLVDGMSNHEVAIHVALGDEPLFEHGAGPFRHSAKFLHRRFDPTDAIVTHVPDDGDLQRLRERQPKTLVKVTVEPGMRLSELKDQDPYSFVLAELDIGATSTHELNQKYEEAVALLPFELTPCDT